MARLQRKLHILLLTFILNFLGYTCLLISFITPYWIVSWSYVYLGIRRIGMWEICFNGISHDISKDSYRCWPTWSPELYEIYSFIMPPWLKAVKFLITLCVLIELPLCGLNFCLWLALKRHNVSGIRKKTSHSLVHLVTWVTFTSTIMKTIAILIFGLAYKYDPFWEPTPEMKHPHYSYGLAILSAFFGIISSIGHFISAI